MQFIVNRIGVHSTEKRLCLFSISEIRINQIRLFSCYLLLSLSLGLTGRYD